ncbi:MAG: type I glyceraldehyde-3-phosphate dehydrogenase [Patescibacteria group bacterium]|jgi:glyceraldehyde 3-phosphate dehydrogenase
MKRIRVGLNGFGRIGRAFTRIASRRDTFDIVAVNTRKTPPETLAYLLQYDSVYRRFEKTVTHDEKSISIDGKNIAVLMAPTIEETPWDHFGVDVVIDATGAFTNKVDLAKHIKGSVKKVILTAPSKDDETPHIVLGVNSDSFNFAGETVISNASCTTNCSSPLFKVLNDNFKVNHGFLTTVHAYTQTQSLLDDSGKSFDRARAAALNIVPSTTGAAKAVVKTIPELKGKVDGMSIRVPVPTGSFTDVTAIVDKPTTVEEVNRLFKEASETSMKGILGYEDVLLVSSDYIGSPYSCIFDANYTKVIENTFVKVFGWYDNEWGYSTRLVDLVEKTSDFI